MSDRVRCFWAEPAPSGRESLRRFTWGKSDGRPCPASPSGEWGHDASVLLGDVDYPLDGYTGSGRDDLDHADPRWPAKCSKCDYVFQPDDQWQHNVERYYAGAGGEKFTLRAPVPGAMWDAVWYRDVPAWCGPDGRSLQVALPNGRVWHVDGRASNCTRPDDNVHKCWVRSGEPPDVTAGKDGDTCSAGGGSILAGGWHGFLRGGWLERC